MQDVTIPALTKNWERKVDMYLLEDMMKAYVEAICDDLPEASVDELMFHARKDFSNATLDLPKTTDGLDTECDEGDSEGECVTHTRKN
jgi:hypothetical protein